MAADSVIFRCPVVFQQIMQDKIVFLRQVMPFGIVLCPILGAGSPSQRRLATTIIQRRERDLNPRDPHGSQAVRT